MIRWVREDAGLSVKEVAKKTGVSEASVNKWEAGTLQPTIRQLRLLGNAAKRPLAVFYLPEPPRKFQALKDFRKLPDGSTTDSSPALRLAMRLASERRQVALDLAKELDLAPLSLAISASIEESVVEVSQRIRDFLEVPFEEQRRWTSTYDALNTWRRAIQDRGVLVFQAPGVEVDEMRGFSSAKNPMPVIVLNNRDAPNGRVFTLLHEFCHLLLRNGGICDLGNHYGQSETNNVEEYCNAVAGKTLVPSIALSRSLVVTQHAPGLDWDDADIGKLAREFSVSREVVVRRLLDAGRITREEYEVFIDSYQSSALRKRPSKPSPVPLPIRTVSQLGSSFIKLVLESYYQEKITTRDVSAHLGVRLKHLGEIEKKVMGFSAMFG